MTMSANEWVLGDGMKVPEAVKKSGISRSKIYELMHSGLIDGYKIGRSLRVSRKSLVAFLESRRVSASFVHDDHEGVTRPVAVAAAGGRPRRSAARASTVARDQRVATPTPAADQVSGAGGPTGATGARPAMSHSEFLRQLDEVIYGGRGGWSA
jgi:excisionase family DNA binding protein